MKKIAFIIFSIILAAGSVSAQKVVVRPGPVPVYPRVVYYPRPYWNPYFYGGLNYSWYNRPAYYNRPTKMEKQIQDIQNEYSDRISSVRADDGLSGKERRAMIRDLRNEREVAISDFKKNYYKQYEN